MTLPAVNGWLIDYRTAAPIYDGQNNAGIAHLTGLCQTGELFLCHTEEELFRVHQSMAAPFIKDNQCVCEPDQASYARAAEISQLPFTPPIRINDQTTIYLAAIALTNGYGVISNQSSTSFSTVVQVGAHFQFPVLNSTTFFVSAGVT
ncbi:MAG: hypothetical protein ABJ242_07965 [Marinomonas sp.]